MSHFFENYIDRTASAVNTSMPTLDDFNIPDDEEFVFPRYGETPEGHYWSEIVAIEPSVTSRGKPAIDACYLLVNDHEDEYRIRLRYPKGSSALRELYATLKRMGFPPNANISTAVGLREKIILDYPDGSTIGSIIKRTPYSSPSMNL